MIFDSHAHYDDEAFDEDREELLGGMQDAGVGAIVNVGASLRGCATRRPWRSGIRSSTEP